MADTSPPAERNVRLEADEMLVWSEPGEIAVGLYARAARDTRKTIDWYWRYKKWPKRWSQSLRLVAILLTTIGTIAPLVGTAGGAGQAIFVWGYVALALAGACVGLDRLFGFSSTWMRYVTTATSLESELGRFHLEWSKLIATRPTQELPRTDLHPFLERVRVLQEFVRTRVEEETGAWVSEYKAGLADLEKRIAAAAERDRPGGLELEIVDAAKFKDGLRIAVDGDSRQTVSGTRAVVRPLFPGQHEVVVSGSIGDTTFRTARLFTLAAGETVRESLTLQE